MSISDDTQELNSYINNKIDIESVASFKGNEHIIKLSLKFDIKKIRKALDEVKAKSEFKTAASGFHALAMTRRKDSSAESDKDLVGRYYTRLDESYEEVSKDELVDETLFSELVDVFKGTYFETIHNELCARYPIGRVRILEKDSYNCNSWHRDPEPRLHIPIITNPGSIMVIDNVAMHLPADGSVWITNNTKYHNFFNGGEQERIHLVACVLDDPFKNHGN